MSDTMDPKYYHRTILHCDLNCFFASVEMLSHEEARNVPMAVCGDPGSRHGIILAKNDPAKALGVQTAETIWQAKQKAPDLLLLPPHHDLYREYSRKVNEIYGTYSDLVEPFGIDESWIDITGSMHLFGGDARAIADSIRQRIRQELGLTISVGVSFNKVFAKLGSDYKKPDATTVIDAEHWQEIVWPLKASDMIGVGHACEKVLNQYGIRTIGDIARQKEATLTSILGKLGSTIHTYACGLDDSPVRPQHETETVKSVGNGTTFPQNLTREEEIQSGLSILCDHVATRLRKLDVFCSGVQVTVKFPDLSTASRQMQLNSPAHLMKELLNASDTLIHQLWSPPSPVRAITVTAIHITESVDSYEQLSLLPDISQQKQEKIENALDSIREKYGRNSISFGNTTSHFSDIHEKN